MVLFTTRWDCAIRQGQAGKNLDSKTCNLCASKTFCRACFHLGFVAEALLCCCLMKEFVS